MEQFKKELKELLEKHNACINAEYSIYEKEVQFELVVGKETELIVNNWGDLTVGIKPESLE